MSMRGHGLANQPPYRTGMDRRRFLLTSLAGTLVAPPSAGAQQAGKVWRVGFLGNVPPLIFQAFREGLRGLGYREGSNLVIEHRAAEHGETALPGLATELARSKVDVIVAPGPVSLKAAAAATTTIPIVTVAGADAVASGWVQSVARPGGNITGLTVAAGPEVEGKWLQLLMELVPALRRVAGLRDSHMIGAEESAFKAIEVAARPLGIQIQMLDVRMADDLADAIDRAIRGRADALIVWTTPMLHIHQQRIVDLTMKHRLPAIAPFADFAAMGGLIAYGPNLPALFRRAAVYVDKILKGSSPAKMPIEQPVPELTLNLKTAKALGLTVPPSLLLRADQVIQ